jgi:hypothetical protein
MKIKQLLLTSLLIISIISLSGCLNTGGGTSPVQGERAEYYKGSTGIDAEFQDLPYKVYYYEGDNDNGFDFGVKLENEGTSFARGATFISGYDPNFIQIEDFEIDENAGGDCTFSLNSFGTDLSDWAGAFDCDFPEGSVGISGRQDEWAANIENTGQLLDSVGINLPFLNDFGFGFANNNGEIDFDVDFNFENFDFNLMYHGSGLLLSMAPMMFDHYLGNEYVLEADDYNYPGGGQEFLQYRANIDSWPPGLDEYPTTLLLTNCYGYVTYAAPLVCIDPMPMTDQRKVCTPGTISMSSQGAPVAITRIEQENTRKKSIFTIHVKNIGNGEIIDWGHLERCSPYYPDDLQAKHKNVLQAFNVRIEDEILDCNREAGRVRLDQNGEGEITCTYDLEFTNLQTAYTTPLIIEFWYGYQETETQNVMFKKV